MKKFKFLFLGLILGVLTCCSPEAKQSLGFFKAVPDEYRVVKHTKLSMPKTSSLPQPGSQDNLKRKKQVTHKSNSILHGIPQNKKIPLHESEQALLQELKIKPHKEIYKDLNIDQEKEDLEQAKWQGKMKDSVLFWKKSNKKKAKIIDAAEESKKLGLDIKN
tara:strand:- start:47262 stop:47747 length:486 start_codon:yes stop_codon:yes gene_type:complete